MNVLVFSDSHGNVDRINEAVSRQISRPAAVIFLGDGLRDTDRLELGGIPLHCVSGNCDVYFSASFAPEEQLFFIGGKKFFITHGHRYNVKSVMSQLLSRGAELSADIVLFGHTHQPFEAVIGCDNQYGIKLDKPMHVMNPGSIGSYPYCFGNIEIDKNGCVLTSHGTLR